MKGAGGTPGGLGSFLAGLAMVVAGGYLLLTRVTVTSGLWQFWGYNAFGLSLVPLLIGIGILFFDGRSLAGWLLTAAGASSSWWASSPTCTSTSGRPRSSTPC